MAEFRKNAENYTVNIDINRELKKPGQLDRAIIFLKKLNILTHKIHAAKEHYKILHDTRSRMDNMPFQSHNPLHLEHRELQYEFESSAKKILQHFANPPKKQKNPGESLVNLEQEIQHWCQLLRRQQVDLSLILSPQAAVKGLKKFYLSEALVFVTSLATSLQNHINSSQVTEPRLATRPARKKFKK